MTAKELETNIELLQQRFYVDDSSPSGLRMRIANGARNPKIIRKANDPAGFIGYAGQQKNWKIQKRWKILIKNTELQVARIIWILIHGSIPTGMYVDHIDGNSLNNRAENLQLLTPSANVRALNSPYECNTSGYLGVFKRSNRGWQAMMRRRGKLHYLGSFSNPKVAAKAYNDAVISWAEAHGETPRYLNPV